MGGDDLLALGVRKYVPNGLRQLRPPGTALAVKEQDIDPIRIEVLTVSINLGARIIAGAHVVLGHEPIGIARESFQRNSQHLRNQAAAVVLGGLKEADSAVVGMADQ